MDLSEDRERFYKLSCIVFDIVPMYLRKLFITKWNEKHDSQKWNSNLSSGNYLFNKLSPELQSRKKEDVYIKKIKEGNESNWDMTILGKVFLDYGLKLIEGPRSIEEWCYPFRDGEKVAILRNIRNQYFAHLPSMSCSADEFIEIIDKVKVAGNGLFALTFEDEIDQIQKSSIKEEKLKDIEKLINYVITDIEKGLNGKYSFRYFVAVAVAFKNCLIIFQL